GGLWWAYRWARNRAEAAVFGLLLILIVAVVFARYLPDTARQGLAQGVGLGLLFVVGAGAVGVHRRSAAERRARSEERKNEETRQDRN
ncbi:MAG: hypothetical protein HY320_07755, partial [Armatimonadetes bacterium]|nr:hypothetical protein [Armatimonadota bacterium]